MEPKSAQELKHALLRLVGQRQRGHRDRLAGRQRLAVGRFLIGIGQRQVGRSRLQHVDQVLREVLADLHDRQVRTQGRCFSAERGAGRAEQGKRAVCRGVVQEVRAAGQRSKAEARRVKGHALDVQGGLAGLVEGQLEVVAIQQVDAVEGSVLRRRRDLLDDVAVLSTVLADALPATVIDWLALSLVEVNVRKPVELTEAVTPMPAVDSAVLSASSELTFPAPAVLVMVSVRAEPVAGVKITVLPSREVVPPVVKSEAEPTAPTVVVTLAFTE